MKKIPLSVFFIAAALLTIASTPLLATAQISIPSGNIPINEYISRLYTFSLAIGGILAVLMIVAGGILYSVSGAVDKQSEGKSMILSAIFGLVLLLGSFLLLKTINPELTVLKNPGAEFITSVPGRIPIMSSCTATSTGAGGASIHECQPGEAPVDLTTGACQCYNKPKEECPPQIFTSCPRRVVIPAGGNVAGTGGLYPISDTSNPSGFYYDEGENLRDDEIVWQYPFYIPSDTKIDAAAVYNAVKPYMGVDKARCIIYAERECNDGKNGSQPLTKCEDPATIRIELKSWVKHC